MGRRSIVNFSSGLRDLKGRTSHGWTALSRNMKSLTPKMAEWKSGSLMVSIIISGKSKSWVLAVGGKCCVTKFSHINIDQCQALPNNQMKHYRPLFNQQNPSGAVPDMSDWENPRIWRFWASGWLSENVPKGNFSRTSFKQRQGQPNIKMDQHIPN